MVQLPSYRIFWLVLLGLTTLFLFFISASQQGSPYFFFVLPNFWFPYVYFFATWAYEYFTGNGKTTGGAGTSISLLGDDDPDTYIFQKWFGYKGALIISIVLGIIISAFFVSEMLVTKQVWIPVSQPLSPSFQVPYTGVFTYLSAVNSQVIAFSNSLLPTVWENPSLIYLEMMLAFLILSFILPRFMPKQHANILALFLALAIAAFVFPYIFHVFSYQAAAFAYIRATIFVLALGIPSILTGFDFPLLFGHFLNNWVASLFLAVSFGIILPPGM